MVIVPNKAKLIEIGRDIEQVKEIVNTDKQGMYLSDVFEFVDFISNQLFYYLTEINLINLVNERISELKCKVNHLDKAEIKGYINSIFDFIISVIQEKLKEPDSS